MRYINLSNLPRDKRDYIDWKHSVGSKLPFEYDGIEGFLTIISVNTGKHGESILDIDYNNNIICNVPTSSIKKCLLGRILEIRHFDFVTHIGQCFQDAKRDYLIVNQRRHSRKSNKNYTQREVEIFCNKCHTKTWMEESRVLPPKNCACRNCLYSPKSGRKSIVETDPWMIPFFPNGHNEAKQYTRGQNIQLFFVCPYCKKQRDKQIAISTLARTRSIGCTCSLSAGRSFPHRLIKNMLDSLSINYIQEANKKDLCWALNYSYDFYLPEFGIIIEAHGKQHYEKGSGYFKNILAETQKNDEKKQKLALDNGIADTHYIVIDCQKSETEYIKNNILKSWIPIHLNVNLIQLDWEELTQSAWKSEKLAILEYCRENPHSSVREVAEEFRVSRDLVKEAQLSIGIYDPSKERMLGVQRQNLQYSLKVKERNEVICKIKRENPSYTSSDIASIVGIGRHAVYKILMQNELYVPTQEKENKYAKISATRKKQRELDYEIICQYRIDNPLVSAKQVGRLTGHAHGYIIRIWKENNLY